MWHIDIKLSICHIVAMRQQILLSQLIDKPRLTAWLTEHVPELGEGPLQAELLHGGTSNAIIRLDRGLGALVLRRPPIDPPPGSADAMMREARILRALKDTDVPHPRLYAACDDLDVIGTSFYVMEAVQGWCGKLTQTDCLYEPPFDKGPDRHALGYALADGLVALSKVDYRAVGLEGFGQPDGFLHRQVRRWRNQLESYPKKYPGYAGRKLEGIDYVADWLEANVPAMSTAGIIHGDYGAPNMMFAFDRPARLLAILDWELSTIGDPLLDLGWLIYNLRDRRDPDVRPASAYYDGSGFPTRQDIAEYYASHTGRDVSRIDYYMVLAQFKLACIVEYKVAKAMVGQESEQVRKLFQNMVPNLILEAQKIARRAG
jgi:aminoglycoside phosphotransferase (APT) family kinase protein